MTDEQLGGKKCILTLVNESIKIVSVVVGPQYYHLVIKPRLFIRSSRIAKRTYRYQQQHI